MSNGQKTNSKFNKIVNILVVVIVVLIAIIAITRVISYDKGYNSIFGTAFIAVETDSMKGDRKENFSRGALLVVDILDENEKKELKVLDVITFRQGDMIITHRIIEVKHHGEAVYYITQGDNNQEGGTEEVYPVNVIGIRKTDIAAIGFPSLFFASQWGFFAAVVVPCFLIVFYCVFRVIVSLKVYNMERKGITPDGDSAESTGDGDDPDAKIAALQAQLELLKKQTSGESEPKPPAE